MRDKEQAFYVRVVQKLNELEIPFLIGGGYMLERYTGISRGTKDLDIHVRRSDVGGLFNALSTEGFHTELTFPHWLGKIIEGPYLVDVIFSSGNGVCEVDNIWFKYADPGEIWGLPARFAPPEESLWSKAFVMERERYDGADVAHVLLRQGERIDWERLLGYAEQYWEVLLAHLINFRFIYPSERRRVPSWLLDELLERLRQQAELPEPRTRVCRGRHFSRSDYLVDINEWGFADIVGAADESDGRSS